MNANINNINEKELNINDMEQVSGGNIIDDIKDVLKKVLPGDPKYPTIPLIPKPEDPIFPRMPELG